MKPGAANNLTLFDRRLGAGCQRLRAVGMDFNISAGGQDSVLAVEMDSVSDEPIFRGKQKAFVLTTSEEDIRELSSVLHAKRSSFDLHIQTSQDLWFRRLRRRVILIQL